MTQSGIRHASKALDAVERFAVTYSRKSPAGYAGLFRGLQSGEQSLGGARGLCCTQPRNGIPGTSRPFYFNRWGAVQQRLPENYAFGFEGLNFGLCPNPNFEELGDRFGAFLTLDTAAQALRMTYQQTLDLDADTVLRCLRLNQAKGAYQRRLQHIQNPPKS